MERDEITRRLKSPDCLRQYFQATGREYATGKNIRCPNAAAHKNGDKNASARIYENPDGALVKCHGCGGAWDIFAVWQMDNGGTFPEAKRALCEMCGITDTGRTAGEKPPAARCAATGGTTATAQAAQPQTPDKAMREYIAKCGAAYDEDGNAGRAYLNGRGISDETARRFHIGYDPQHNAVIIPQGAGYMRRSIDPNAEQKDKCRYYPKGAPRVLFNGDEMLRLGGFDIPIFIVEGEMDALSVAEAGGVAVSCGGTGGIGKVVKEAQAIGCGLYVPCMDRDDAGEKAQADLVRRLKALGGGVTVFEDAPKILMPDAADGTHPKDANEGLQRDAAAFRAAVVEVIGKAQAYAKEESNPFDKERNGLLLRRFCDIPPTKDEAEDEDALIKGFALAKGEGWILAGEPGAGKSSLLMQLAFFAGAGKEFFGFGFTRPLRVFYLQTELQERKLNQSKNSLQYAARAVFSWSDEEYGRAAENVFYDTFMIGNVCEDITEYLVKAFSTCRFDLLLLDPLLTFAKDDLSLAKPTSELLYKQVMSVMGGRKHKTPDGTPVKFGVIIAHHMGKPRMDGGKKIERGQYATAGSYMINAWARFQLNLSRYAGNVYELLAAKNPECASWKDEDGNDTDHIYIKRAARGERYWTLATKEEAEAAKDGTKKPTETDAQRKEREERETRHAIDVIAAHLRFTPMGKDALYKWCAKNDDPVFKGFKSYTVKGNTYGVKKPCNIAFDAIITNPLAYGVMKRTEQAGNGREVATYGGEIPPELQQAAQSAAAKVGATASPTISADAPAPDEPTEDEDGGDPYEDAMT